MKKIQRLTFIAVLVAQALILHIIEGMLPVIFITPGAKLGLSNIISLTSLYILGFKDTFLVIILRILLNTLLAPNPSSIIYSLSGGILSLLAMHAAKSLGKDDISLIGISVSGAFFHNVGQIMAFTIIIENINIVLYLPVLTIAGVGTGIFVGLTSNYLLKALKKLPFYRALVKP
jgi:heptaprenyl diphosphate synthase